MAGQKRTHVKIDAHMPPALYNLIDGFDAAVPHVGDFLYRNGTDFDRFSIRRRDEGDWIAVLKAFDDAGAPVVCFGNGYDFFSCILGLEASLRNGKWREDRPWGG